MEVKKTSEAVLRAMSRYRKVHKEKVNEYLIQYRKKRYAEDEEFKEVMKKRARDGYYKRKAFNDEWMRLCSIEI